MVQKGDNSPDFAFTSTKGESLSLARLKEEGATAVLFFYPKDETPTCTKEACHFRDRYEDFQDAGAWVIGLSSDSDKKHSKFADKHRLPFHLVSDADKTWRKAFGVKNTLAIIPGRVTFVIGPDAKIHHRFESATDAFGHVDKALEIVKGLSQA